MLRYDFLLGSFLKIFSRRSCSYSLIYYIFGDLIQYRVDDDKLDYPLLFSVKEISREQAKEYLTINPGLAKHPETGVEFSEEDALRKIQQSVELVMRQRFHVEIINPKSGIVINFGGNQTKEESFEGN